MRARVALLSIVAVEALVALAACEETSKATADAAVRADASARASASASAAPTGDGCLRSGLLDTADTDPACVYTRPTEDAMRDISKRIAMEVSVEPKSVIAGVGATLRLAITNTASTETLILLDTFTRVPTPRPDWTRLVGVPDVKGASEQPKLHFIITTLDPNNRPIDAMPTVTGQGAPSPTNRVLGIRIKPGGKVTSVLQWWAVRIPPPAPVYTDDAGHRYYPKTFAVPLTEGEYGISVDVPLHGVIPQERTVITRVHVEPAPKKKDLFKDAE